MNPLLSLVYYTTKQGFLQVPNQNNFLTLSTLDFDIHTQIKNMTHTRRDKCSGAPPSYSTPIRLFH